MSRLKLFYLILLVSGLSLMLTCCSKSQQDATPPSSDMPFMSVQQGGGEKQILTAQQRATILKRAEVWINAKVPYGIYDNDSNNDYQDGYRTDCSGFVSYAWQLQKPGLDTTSFVKNGYAVDVSIEELQPGDALNNNRSDTAGHMVLFVGWVNTEHTQFRAYDLNTNPGYASEKIFTLEQKDGEWTIVELDPWAEGPYYAQSPVGQP
jgi:cell wall-associated NlpC family hydrolase